MEEEKIIGRKVIMEKLESSYEEAFRGVEKYADDLLLIFFCVTERDVHYPIKRHPHVILPDFFRPPYSTVPY